MTDGADRQHGLESRLKAWPTESGIALSVRDDLGHINLRGNPEAADFIRITEKALGQSLPTEPNTVSEGSLSIFWLGPDEWLILAPYEKTAGLASGLEQALRGMHSAVNIVSGGQIAFGLDGASVREVLAKGCTLDLHPKVFGRGQCAQSSLAKAGVLIGCMDDDDLFLLVVRRSFSDYLVSWLMHVA